MKKDKYLRFLNQRIENLQRLKRKVENNENLFEDENFEEWFMYEMEMTFHRFPYHPHIDELLHEIHRLRNDINERGRLRCPISENQSGNLLEFIVGANGKKEGIKEIRDFTSDAKKIIIIDPYIYGGDTEKTDIYLEHFKKASRIQNLERLHIIYGEKYGNTKKIRDGIKDLARENRCNFTEINTELIHDRIWIKNGEQAIVVGTSFGGLGNRVCFILELPNYDLVALKDFLKEKELLPHNAI